MATPIICRSCVRRLYPSQAPRSLRPNPSTVQHRSILTPAPLYLDFLAPSARHPRSRPEHPSPTPKFPRTSSTRTRPFSSTPHHRAVAIQNPRQDDTGSEMLIHISPRAAHRLETISQKENNPNLALRVAVESGGCHGFQYLMSLVNNEEGIDAEEDTVFENEERVEGKSGEEGNGYKARIVMDEPSLELLKGSTVDYTMELIGSQFKVVGIPGATSSCGCGTSFDIAA